MVMGTEDGNGGWGVMVVRGRGIGVDTGFFWF